MQSPKPHRALHYIIRPDTQQRPRCRPAARRRWLARLMPANCRPRSISGPYLPDVIGAIICFAWLLILLKVWRRRRPVPSWALQSPQITTAGLARCAGQRGRGDPPRLRLDPRPLGCACRSVSPGTRGSPELQELRTQNCREWRSFVIQESPLAFPRVIRYSLFVIFLNNFGSTMLCLSRCFTCFYVFFFLAAFTGLRTRASRFRSAAN